MIVIVAPTTTTTELEFVNFCRFLAVSRARNATHLSRDMDDSLSNVSTVCMRSARINTMIPHD